MFEASQLITFIIASIILLVIPGPAIFFIVAKSIDQGRTAGIVSVLGIQLGTLFHIGAASLGISAILVTSALAFSLVKYAGAAYLIYLGVKALISKNDTTGLNVEVKKQKLNKVFFQGMIVNVLNPKTALFFFAFLPQFINPAAGSPTVQIFTLGLLFIILSIVSDGIYAMLAGSIKGFLHRNPVRIKIQKYISGVIYIILGLVTLVAEPVRNK
ncbi:RhtB family transporter [Fulvivirga imtechensis AK7]|uniref:RhtB family transporter n=1 Tax=Fulvivirga imtechensis AK7 TaxID=1237149 RepID=L8JJK8_9BACT|nr:LysE family translocator [Fulvivirga imtechensis]ELR68428.1 RhtB family transporter [Fulvivirga imtechensis AK7]